jgi:thymidylate synthase
MEHQYHQLLEDILNHGEKTEDRTGVGTLSIFGYQMRFNLQDGFPAVTTKKLAWKSCSAELLWFLEGSTDERRLAELTYGKPREDLVGKRTIWTDNADAQGKALGYVNDNYEKQLGPVYGYQWRNFGGASWIRDSCGGFDQLKWLVNEIRKNPSSRRLILSAWSAEQIELMALPPCHYTAQFSVRGNKLSCMMTQRSGDAFLGIPFNIASYSLLTHIIAKECNLEVGDFVHTIGDAHIYLNHVEQVKEQLSRDPYDLPKLYIDDDFSLEPSLNNARYKFPLNTVDKFKLVNYISHNTIKAPMAV